ncbi:MAG: hypothetical protein ABSG97_05085 [Sedimentisphaerales bacterium]|jgi:hypothetical protein
MKREEIEQKKIKLDEILKMEDARVRLEKLVALAKEVGASVTRMENVQTGETPVIGPAYLYELRNVITEAEIVHNIQESLQTHVMIDMCNTAARNWETARASARAAQISVIVSLFAMLAAWVAVVVTWWRGR